ALVPRLSGQVAQRAGLLAGIGFPVESILVTRSTAQVLCVYAGRFPIVWERGIFLLPVHVGVAEVDHTQLVAADAASEDFVLRGLGIEYPLVARLGQGNGDGPLFFAHDQFLAVGA